MMDERQMDGHLMPTINRLPLVIGGGEGAKLYTEDGHEFIDMCADVGTISLGYGNQMVINRLTNFLEAGKPHQLADMLPHPTRWECAERLCRVTGMDKVFFANSGTEANETAIKLARKYQHDKGNDKCIIASIEGQFAGRTGWSLAATDSRDSPYHKEGFGPMPTGFTFFKELSDLVPGDVAAIFMSPISGNNEVRLHREGLLKEVREFCDTHDILLIFDEVQVGMGRTGTYTAGEYFGIQPDVLTLGKGIALGYPMSACLATPKCSGTLAPRTHYTTFGGGPFVCEANLILLDWLEDGGLQHIRDTSKIMEDFFTAQDWIETIDGVGVHWGILPRFDSFGYDGYQFAERAREFGLLIATFRPKGQIKITPPLNISPLELQDGLKAILDTHNSFLK